MFQTKIFSKTIKNSRQLVLTFGGSSTNQDLVPPQLGSFCPRLRPYGHFYRHYQALQYANEPPLGFLWSFSFIWQFFSSAFFTFVPITKKPFQFRIISTYRHSFNFESVLLLRKHTYCSNCDDASKHVYLMLLTVLVSRDCFIIWIVP